MEIKMNYDELLDNIYAVVKSAGSWSAGNGSGEVQLYARFDPEAGHVTEFFDVAYHGHNTWQEGEGIICVWIERWFHPLEHEDYSEWLENEFYDDPALYEEFKKKYQEEFDDEIEDEKDAAWKYDKFQSLFPGKWEELEQQWEEEALEHYINEIESSEKFRYTLEELENFGFDISNQHPTTQQFQAQA